MKPFAVIETVVEYRFCVRQIMKYHCDSGHLPSKQYYVIYTTWKNRKIQSDKITYSLNYSIKL